MTEFEVIAQVFLVALATVGLFFTVFEVYLRWYERKPRIEVAINKNVNYEDYENFHDALKAGSLYE